MKKINKWKIKLHFYRFLYFLTKNKKFLKKCNKYRERICNYNQNQNQNYNTKQENILTLDVGDQDCIIAKKAKKILIIGRDKIGDSIGNHTKGFLLTADYSQAEFYLFDEYTNDLYKYESYNEKKFLWHGDIHDIDGRYYDMMIFCNVIDYGLGDGSDFVYKIPKKRSLISYVYAVFEGTVPPKNWVNIINCNFDGLLVPINELKKIFEANGVLIPVFVLPVTLNLKKYFSEFNIQKNKKFRFGWQGTLDPRKNPKKVLQAFIDAFGDNNDVELYMQSRYVNNSQYAQEFYKQVENAPKNVHFVNEMLSDADHFKLINSFDAYVFPSRGEGYSVTPREALALGKIVILSDIYAHKNICNLDEEDGLLWCKANIEVPAIHVSLNNQICGNEFDVSTEELVAQMKKAYEQRNILYKHEKVKKRKDSVRPYSIENLKKQYNTLLFPNNVKVSSNNILTDTTLETNSIDFQTKYNHYRATQKKFITIDPVNDAGFCSLFNKYVSHLVWAEKDEIIIPDWRVRQLKINKLKKTGKIELNHFCYGKETDGNVFLQFFEKPYKQIPNELYQTNMMYYVSDKVLEIDDYNGFKEPNLTYIHSYKLYNDENYFPIFRQKYNDAVNKYIVLKKEIQDIINNFYETKMKGKFIISAHIRCQSHVLELLEDYPTFELYEKNILKILKEQKININSDDWRLFIATDNEDALNYFKARYPSKIIYQKNVKRLTSDQEKEYKNIRDKKQKDIAGYELQERNAKSDDTRNISLGIDMITDMYLLSKGDIFLFVNSNVSTAVSYLNPSIKMMYCKNYDK